MLLQFYIFENSLYLLDVYVEIHMVFASCRCEWKQQRWNVDNRWSQVMDTLGYWPMSETLYMFV